MWEVRRHSFVSVQCFYNISHILYCLPVLILLSARTGIEWTDNVMKLVRVRTGMDWTGIYIQYMYVLSEKKESGMKAKYRERQSLEPGKLKYHSLCISLPRIAQRFTLSRKRGDGWHYFQD